MTLDLLQDQKKELLNYGCLESIKNYKNNYFKSIFGVSAL